jgi:hypothetical protein
MFTKSRVPAGAQPIVIYVRRWTFEAGMSVQSLEVLRRTLRIALLLALSASLVDGQSGSKLTGRVLDPSDRVVPSAEIQVRNLATLTERTVTTNREGIYEIPVLPVGIYRMQVKASGFRHYILEPLTTEVARTVVQDIHLEVGGPVPGSYGQIRRGPRRYCDNQRGTRNRWPYGSGNTAERTLLSRPRPIGSWLGYADIASFSPRPGADWEHWQSTRRATAKRP